MAERKLPTGLKIFGSALGYNQLVLKGRSRTMLRYARCMIVRPRRLGRCGRIFRRPLVNASSGYRPPNGAFPPV